MSYKVVGCALMKHIIGLTHVSRAIGLPHLERIRLNADLRKEEPQIVRNHPDSLRVLLK
jgi:hypothetical protein